MMGGREVEVRLFWKSRDFFLDTTSRSFVRII